LVKCFTRSPSLPLSHTSFSLEVFSTQSCLLTTEHFPVKVTPASSEELLPQSTNLSYSTLPTLTSSCVIWETRSIQYRRSVIWRWAATNEHEFLLMPSRKANKEFVSEMTFGRGVPGWVAYFLFLCFRYAHPSKLEISRHGHFRYPNRSLWRFRFGFHKERSNRSSRTGGLGSLPSVPIILDGVLTRLSTLSIEHVSRQEGRKRRGHFKTCNTMRDLWHPDKMPSTVAGVLPFVDRNVS